jgi:RNA polymerase sigma factor (sigma-70 family)
MVVTMPTSGEDRRAAFERSVCPEARRLFGIALMILEDAGEAEDAVQETLISAWRAWDSLRDPSKQTAWLTRICVNQCLRSRHRLRRWRILGARDLSVDPRDDLEGRLLIFQGAFRSLSPAQRAVVILHFRDGFTVSECAGFIGCRPGTARSHLGRAVAKLRKEFADA